MIKIFDLIHLSRCFYKVTDELNAMAAAMAGDMVLKVTPATSTALATAQNAALHKRRVVVTLEDAAGNRQTWFKGDLAAAVAQSVVGTGAISVIDGTPQMVDGKCEIVISYTGVFAVGDTNTLTIAALTIMGTVVASKASVETSI